MINILGKLEEVKTEYEEQKKEIKNNYNISKEKIITEYKKDRADEELQTLKNNSKKELENLFNQYISKSKEKIERAEKQLKTDNDKDTLEIDQLKRNNKLQRLLLVKDNPKALLKEVENNKDDKYILATIEDMVYTLEKDSIKDNIITAIGKIKRSYPENLIEQAKQIIRIEEIYKSNSINIFTNIDTSSYELGNKPANKYEL